MKTPDLDRIVFVTRHLGEFQSGVAAVMPLGLVLLFGGLASYFRSLPLILLQLAALVGFFLLAPRARKSLEARFGKVEKKRWGASAPVRGTMIFGGALLIIGLAFGLAYWVDSFHQFSFPSARLLYLVYGAASLSIWISREARLSEVFHLMACALFLSIAARGALPALAAPEWLLSRSGIAIALEGSALVLTGLLDYWRLVRTFPPLDTPAEERRALASETER